MSAAIAIPGRLSDAQVVALVRAGDPAGFDVLVARHRPAMVAYARAVLGEHRSAADDVVQEALIRAFRALRRDEREIALRAWLLTLTRNCGLDEIRRVRSFPLPAERAGEAAAHEESPERIAGRRARLRGVVGDVATLPDEQRHALLRHAVDGASHADIAAELGVTPAASRMLVTRARDGLVKSEAARDERCDVVRADLLRAHVARRRASAHAHRHLVACAGCRGYRRELRSVGSALRLLQPGPFLALGALGAKAAAKVSAAGAGGGGAVSAGASGGGLAAALATVAVGGTVLFAAGDPSPLAIRSPALPAGFVRAGQPLPEGTSVVAKRVASGPGVRTVRLACPEGQVVADLLPPAAGRVDAAYARRTVPGLNRTARILVRSRGADDAGIAVLCRRPVRGSIVPGAATMGAPRDVGVVCRRTVQLRSAPGGAVRASGRLGQPVAVLRRAGAWTRVRTDLGQAGWVERAAVCAALPRAP